MKKIFSIKSSKLIFILSILFATIYNLKFWNMIYEIVHVQSFKDYVFIFSLPLILIVPYFVFFSIICVPYIFKPLISIIFIVSSVVNYMMFRYGVLINDKMVENVLETTPREASDFVTLPSFLNLLLLGILPSLFIIFSNIEYGNFLGELKKRIKRIIFALIFLVILVIPSYKSIVAYGRNHGEFKNAVNVLNYVRAVRKCIKKKFKKAPPFVYLDKDAKFNKKNTKPYLFVLMVGEASRRNNYSLYNYERETNPLLKNQDVIFYDKVVSCDTATAFSLPCMFSDMKRENIDFEKVKYRENFLDILKQVGFDVIWKENDDGCKGMCDRVDTEVLMKINDKRFCEETFCKDDILLERLENILKNGIKNDTIIVLHTMGSHGPSYYKRYPDEFKKFTPTCDTADIQDCTKEEIVNTYDNTILYTDYIISSVIDLLKKEQNVLSTMLYVSDHGESLGEKNLYLHGLPYKFAPDVQKDIPMILWFSDEFKKEEKIDVACLEKNAKEKEYSHDNLFHSVLGLLNVDTKVYEKDLDIFSECF